MMRAERAERREACARGERLAWAPSQVPECVERLGQTPRPLPSVCTRQGDEYNQDLPPGLQAARVLVIDPDGFIERVMLLLQWLL